MNQNVLAILIIGAYMFIPLWIGALAGERELNTPEDFFVQSRAMGSVAVFFTVEATWWSAFAFLGSNASFYSNGPVYWTTIAWDFLFGILFYVIGKRIWLYGKIHGCITPSDFFRDIYGSEKLGNLITFTMLLFTLPYLQIQLTGGAYLIQVASKGLIPWEMGGLIFCVVIVIYVWTGGLRAVAWADIFYEILMLFGIISAGFFIVSEVGGISTLFGTLKKVAPEALTLPGPTGNAGPMLWISMFLLVPMGAIMGPQLWTRMYAVNSPRFFDLMPFLLGFTALINISPMLIGNAGIILVPGLEKADMLLPVILFKYAPFALASLILAGAASAAMSTSNSQIHSISAVYAIDIHKKYINKNIDDASLIHIGRWAILAFASCSYLLSVLFPGLLIQIGLIALSGTAQVIVPTLGALFWRRSTHQGAIWGLLTGIIILTVLSLTSVFHFTFVDIYPGLIALFANSVIFVVVSLLTPPKEKYLLDKYDHFTTSFERIL